MPRIKIETKFNSAAILGLMEPEIRQGVKEIGFAIVADWNTKAKANLGRSEGNGDTNNLLRSAFAGMWDFDLKYKKSKRQVEPRQYPTKHGGRSKGYGSMWAKWTTDNFSDLIRVAKSAANQKYLWTITMYLDNILSNLSDATSITSSKGKVFSYCNTSLSKYRIGKLKRSFNSSYIHVANRFGNLIFGG